MQESDTKENQGALIFCFCFELKPTMTRRQTAGEQAQKRQNKTTTRKQTKKERAKPIGYHAGETFTEGQH